LARQENQQDTGETEQDPSNTKQADAVDPEEDGNNIGQDRREGEA
jgi:hypothetical protein